MRLLSHNYHLSDAVTADSRATCFFLSYKGSCTAKMVAAVEQNPVFEKNTMGVPAKKKGLTNTLSMYLDFEKNLIAAQVNKKNGAVLTKIRENHSNLYETNSIKEYENS